MVNASRGQFTFPSRLRSWIWPGASDPLCSVSARPAMARRFGFCSHLEASLRRISYSMIRHGNQVRIPLAITSMVLIALHGTVNAGPVRACAQVSGLVDGQVGLQLENLPEAEADATQLRTQLRACLSSRNICSVVYDTRNGKGVLVAADVTSDLPAQYLSAQGKPSAIVLVRSIPRVRTDSNQYCLISAKSGEASSVQQWDVSGWVIALNASEPLPLQRQVLDDKAASDPTSLRGLAAALWFFAERMSGQPSPQ